MTVRRYSSTSQETNLTSALSAIATTMVVNSASALLSSITPAAGETFTVVIDPDTALEEIVDVISPSAPGSNTLITTLKEHLLVTQQLPLLNFVELSQMRQELVH